MNQHSERRTSNNLRDVTQVIPGDVIGVSHEYVWLKGRDGIPLADGFDRALLPLVGDRIEVRCNRYGEAVGYSYANKVGAPAMIQSNLAGVREVVGVRLECRIAALCAAIDTLGYDAHHGKSTEITDLAEEYETWLSRA